MSKKRWFRFHIDRWFNGTLGLAPNEIAAYITVICELYDNDGFAKLNCTVMARRCGMRPSSFQKAIDSLVAAGKLDIQRGFLTNKTVSEEIIEREKLGDKAAKTRAKLAQNAAKKTMISAGNGEKYPDKQNTEIKSILPPSFTESENIETHPSLDGFYARQKARKY